MIQALGDKIIVEIMKATKTKSGIMLPDSCSDPQSYGRVLSCGDDVSEYIKPGMFLVFHTRGGQDVLMEKRLMKVLKNEEVYGVLDNEELKETLEPIVFGDPRPMIPTPDPNSRIVRA